MSRQLFQIFTIALMTASCAELNIGRSYLTEMEHDDSRYFKPQEDFQVVSGDTGKDWMDERERRARTPASENDLADDYQTRSLKKELRDLEGMQTEENLEFYQKYKTALGSTSSRIYFLKIPARERQDYLMSRGIIEEPKVAATTMQERMLAAQKRDILVGMSKSDVISSWGKPERVEVAGNPRNENERWLYRMARGSKYIYFESGEVQGWE